MVTLPDTSSKKLLLRMQDLPTLPTTMASLLRMISDPRVSAAAFAAVIEKDQVLTARLLRVVNSSILAYGRKLSSISEAVVVLGTNRIREISSAVALGPLFQSDSHVNKDFLWMHALATAQWTKEILAYLELPSDAPLYTAGLLHDLGILILAQHGGQAYEEVLDTVKKGERNLYDIESEVLGTTHGEIGGELCAKWNFPADLTHMIRCHHATNRQGSSRDAILALADYVATETGTENFEWERREILSPDVLSILHLGENDVDKLMDQAHKILEFISFFEEE